MNFKRSEALFEEAQKYLPGGVDSPVRAFKSVGGIPPFMVKGAGSKIYDADGNEYIDYICSWGPLILGHSHPQVIDAIKKVAELGTSFGAPTELEITLAKMVTEAIPSIEMVRFVNSGTEATMTALRLARGYTGRDKVIKFAGGYHGHADGLLVKGGSGMATLSLPNCPGVPASYVENTLVATYNNADSVEQLFTKYPNQIAAVIVEPIAANIGLIPPQPGFLEALRSITSDNGALLIFDEVISGFRVSYGGAQELYGITPDLTCLGKIIGGGMPVGAYGGKTLKVLSQPGVYEQLDKSTALLETGIRKAIDSLEMKIQVSRLASLLTIFFTDAPLTDYDSVAAADTAMFAKFHQQLLKSGIYWAPSQFEAAFISLAHSDADIKTTIDKISEALSFVAR